MSHKRPDPVRWLWYQYAGTLPPRYREWVLFDGTCRTWLARVFLRGFVQIAPVLGALLAILVLIGGAWPIALGSVLLGLLVSLRFTAAYAVESVDHRLAKNGYPQGHGTAVRRALDADANAGRAKRYRERWRHSDDNNQAK
ncbi:hypothetical protein EV193_107265 [Herbihabitans rhizosphaerae]|uniref:DUF5313 domain-containing protein n=1 Tax=Herbihabitans rhizosphaerae TaxID=1872711 RepID=A0A4Q7KK49_9PSEU|nr:DUF5313 family protein [Herbihabitans rhizosphaerae]RZS36584.1 hypothetical protein EV193_107265 [Herbihabitans rhizosphaerae]